MDLANLDTAPGIGLYRTRLVADHMDGDRWTVRVALRDRRGALAAIAGSFAGAGIAVCSARITTGPGGIVIDVFSVRAALWTDWDAVRCAVDAALAMGWERMPVEPVDVTVAVEDNLLRGRSVVTVRAPDRVGLLARVAGAFTRAGLEIHDAVITTEGKEAVDVFEVTGAAGGPLTAGDLRAVRSAMAGRRVRRRPTVRRPGHRG